MKVKKFLCAATCVLVLTGSRGAIRGKTCDWRPVLMAEAAITCTAVWS